MLNKSAFLRGIFACALTLCPITCAMAGDIKLVSDTMDIVCRVEITWGPNAPDGTPIEQFLEVEEDWSITKQDRLCYRRASTPDNCDSGMTQWNTRWHCIDNAGSGTKALSLE